MQDAAFRAGSKSEQQERASKAGIKSEHQDKRNEQAQDTKMESSEGPGAVWRKGEKCAPGRDTAAAAARIIRKKERHDNGKNREEKPDDHKSGK